MDSNARAKAMEARKMRKTILNQRRHNKKQQPTSELMESKEKKQAKEARRIRKSMLDQRRDKRKLATSVHNFGINPIVGQSRTYASILQSGAFKRQRTSTTTNVTSMMEDIPNMSDSEEIDPPMQRTFSQVWDFGKPNQVCASCGAIVWYEERNRKSRDTADPKFSICCLGGKVQLPLLQETPIFLKELLEYRRGPTSTKFRTNIRMYNGMFAFTSMGGIIDKTINNSRGPYVFRINGQNHHKIGSLLPMDGQNPKFAQLYICDPGSEVEQRSKALFERDSTNNQSADIDPEIVDGLMKMFDQHNELSKVFRMARERFRQPNEFLQVRIRLIGTRNKDGRQYNLPSANEVAALMIGSGDENYGGRDVIVEHKDFGLKRITEVHPSFMAMQYPILFPYAEDGYRNDIMYSDDINLGKSSKRPYISIREYYAFRIQQRIHEGQTLLHGGRLYQQFLVDAYACIEENRLSWVRKNQDTLRTELYNGLRDTVIAGDARAVTVGKRLVLPSTFTGGPRYMIQNYQDAIAICRAFGPPSLFITFTCNPKWKEIESFVSLIPGQKVEDRPDIVSRVFKIKLHELMMDLQKRHVLGKVEAATYTIEFQKRGLPHAHILLFLCKSDRPTSAADIDRIISAELPNKGRDPLAFDTVVQFMIHGPCVNGGPCIVDEKCSKHFPKKWSSETIIDNAGFPVYRRRKNSRKALKNNLEVDNRWVVPHNIDLIVKYQAHINVEFCNQTRSVKYLFKYINKGNDRATVVIEENSRTNEPSETQVVREIDEIKKYLDCRYISASESCWRIFDFKIHFREPSVQRLSYHLEDQQPVIFRDNDDLAQVANNLNLARTMFIEWMRTNCLYEDARQLTYVEFPTKWVWNINNKKKWTRRTKGQTIGRIYYAHPTSGERFYLRLLLNIVRGPRNFKEIRTVNDIVYPDNKSACSALGLLDDDDEWEYAIEEASHWATGNALRHMFVTLLVFSEIVDPLQLWNTKWELLSDDIVKRQRSVTQDDNLQLDVEQIKNLAMCEIEKIMNQNGRSLKDFPTLPFPNMSSGFQIANRYIREELDHDREMLQQEFLHLHDELNAEQKNIFNMVTQAVETQAGGLFFVYGCGGTGKTFLWNTIISKLRSEGKIVLAVASSAIAALLLPRGRTAHSKFKIPVDLDETSCCNISQQSHLAELIRNADLIVWDEAPMQNRYSFEAVDRTLRDLMQVKSRQSAQKVFGGKTILLGGDFRQILPVIQKGTRETIVSQTINRSNIWNECHVFLLTTNMRLRNQNSDAKRHSLSEFSKWVLDIGDGRLPTISMQEGDEPNWIKIPEDILIPIGENPIKQIIDSTYPEITSKFSEATYLRDKCILAPTNECVDEINSYITASLLGEGKVYLSTDTISPMSEAIENQDILFPPEFLNTLNLSGLPTHKLHLKVGVPIMLLRNLNPTMGLCNGTRLIIKKVATKVIQAEIITGTNIGRKVIIHRIIMSSKSTKWPFILKRKQFPVKICFAMTINKSQGQTLQTVGLYLPTPVFTHGQLYVAVSRTTSREGLKILIQNKENEPQGCTRNIVYQEIFNNLPTCI